MCSGKNSSTLNREKFVTKIILSMNIYRLINHSRLLASQILVMVLFFVCLPLQAANITVDVSRNPVHVNESVDITFNADGETDEDPDFSPLRTDFEILSQGSNSQVSIMNGSVSRNYQWTVTVIPKTTGGLIIPSISFGSDQSPATVLQVTSQPQQLNSKVSGDVFLEVEASPLDPYVQAQVVYTVRVFHRVGITQAGLSEPEIDNAVVEQLQKDSKYRTQRGNQTYDVFERRYAIFPQSSGQLNIAPIRLNAQIVTGKAGEGSSVVTLLVLSVLYQSQYRLMSSQFLKLSRENTGCLPVQWSSHNPGLKTLLRQQLENQ